MFRCINKTDKLQVLTVGLKTFYNWEGWEKN